METLNDDLNDFRCSNCNKLLAKYWVIQGNVVIKCARCKKMNYVIKTMEPIRNLLIN